MRSDQIEPAKFLAGGDLEKDWNKLIDATALMGRDELQLLLNSTVDNLRGGIPDPHLVERAAFVLVFLMSRLERSDHQGQVKTQNAPGSTSLQ